MEKENVNFLYKTMVERDPQKRKVKPVQNPLLDFDLGESSDDSDFRIEDHETDDDDDSMCSGDEGDVAGGAESAGSSDSSDNEGKVKSAGDTKTGSPSVGELLAQAKQQMQPGSSSAINAAKLLICCACLGDRSDAINEIVECDGCGVTVHEACYGVSDTASVSSTVSSCSTEPWFCEACKAGVNNPNCELCPNHGGIFKETDVGKWVHLVCALYVPGVAFGEVDKLSNVTLFEMQYTKWGGKACQLCEDQRFVRTGVCIGCDAGMCRTVFHVTCAQREGLLAEAHCDELEHADPFYAHCRLHTDKVLMKKRRRNWLAVQLRMHERQAELDRRGNQNVSSEQQRIKRKLLSHRQKYLAHKGTRVQPWVPTQKMPRLLTTSASACRKLIHKAELMGVDCQALETQEAQVASLIDVRKKWNIPAAFSVEYIGYYLDRNIRIAGMKRHLEDLLKTNNQLLKKQQSLRCLYDQLVKDKKEMQQQIDADLATVRSLRQVILATCPTQQLPPEPCMAPPPAPAPVIVAPTVYTPHPVPARRESKHHRQEALTLNECGICRQTKDQHLLAKCDTCHRFYHLGCLNPPLTRMPKKTKLMGWQCSECDKETSGSEPECPDPEAPRKLRYSQGDAPVPTYRHFDPSDPCPQLQRQPMVALTPLDITATVPALVLQASRLLETAKGSGKRRHKHQHRLGPNGEKHKRRRKKKHMADQPRIKITIKPILPPSDQPPGSSQQQMFVASQPTLCLTPIVAPSSSTPVTTPSPVKPRARRPSNRPEPDVMTQCDTCHTTGTNQNLVRCDECRKCFHFHCLEPPVKKSPKRRGYSWHCADCDPTDSDHSNKR